MTLCGCSTFASPQAHLPYGGFSSWDQLLVWTDDAHYNLHSVAIRDSIIDGVPWGRSASCPRCRVRIPLDAVDSVALKVPSPERRAVLVAVVGAFAVLALQYMSQLAGMGGPGS